MTRQTALLSLVALTSLACKPPGIDDGSGTQSESSTSTSSSSTTDATETSTSGVATETGTGNETDFVPSPDWEGVQCDLIDQMCPPGEKCVPYSTAGDTWDAQKCVPVIGDQKAGESCIYEGIVVAVDDCDATSMCWNVEEVDGQLVGTCVPFCTGNWEMPECPASYHCVLGNTLALCLPSCDPLLQDCDAPDGCYWTGASFECVITTSNIPVGEPCGYPNDCAAGNICVDQAALPSCAGASCCTSFCDVSAPDCAAVPGTSCVAFFEQGAAEPGYEDVGVCVVP